MTLEEEIFNDEIERAQRMGHGRQEGYRVGYLTGLMRACCGSQAVSDHLHAALPASLKGEATALGYSDEYQKHADRRSRPGTVSESPASTTPAESAATNPYATIRV